MKLKDLIEDFIEDKNSHIIGYADMSGLLGSRFKGFNTAIVIAKKLDDTIADAVKDGPTEEYYHHYSDINSYLTGLVHSLKGLLEQHGVRAMAIEPTMSDNELDEEAVKSLRTDFSHKMAATRAGIGWIGKTDLLVTERFGPRLRLATLLIDAEPGIYGTPTDKSRCGSCTICVDTCPAGAANGRPWDIHTDRNEFYDPFKCRKTCRSLSRERLGREISLCGICVSVCPHGRT